MNRVWPEERSEYLALRAEYREHELIIGGSEIMQDWERPLMRALAKEAARPGGHVLEVGFGMGISASYLIEGGCSRYTVIEPHPGVLQEFRRWRSRQRVPVNAVEGFWEDVIDGLGDFDSILFDTYPTTADESPDTFFLPFIAKASDHLKPGGVFTFYSGQADELPPQQLDLLNQYFSEVRTYHVLDLNPPETCQYFQGSQMVVPVCIK